ncbi:probable transmembrane ascorbate ferrireductase 2 [Phtheirospermum japonicum]|uniref:Probable transmembrane ascorbate ferrireductase 2 n=1 Tax=Phtheirospermum japonicum TaxID=374723 RepID=A0A830C7L0_9LAMI|nr:probable transmembrane ascorbate ferrireductase 2 [Phtheirospermum japonicum]
MVKPCQHIRPSQEQKASKKLVHISFQFLAFYLSVNILWATWKLLIEKGVDNLYSLYSSLGLSCLVLFSIQLGAGFVTFWYPGGSRNNWTRLLSWQIFFGIYIYVLAIATGFLERSNITSNEQSNNTLLDGGIACELLGITVVALSGFVFLGVVSPVHGKMMF